MRRTEQLQGLRLMKFEDVYGRCYRGDLSQAEASEILGMSERTFRRWRERYVALGKVPAKVMISSEFDADSGIDAMWRAFSRSSSGRRTTPASPARPRTPARPSWLLPARSRTSSAPRRTASSRATTPCATRTARCRSRPIATAATTSRRRSGCTNIPTATWPSSTDPGVWRATGRRRNHVQAA